MHYLLEKLLKKRGIEKVSELSQEEARDFDHWQKILSEGEITLDKLVEFCNTQKRAIETQWQNLDNSKEKNERLIMLHNVYSTFLKIISAPKTEREFLEKYLKDLIDTS